MKFKRRLKLFHLVDPQNSIENRVAHLEGARTGKQWLISIIIPIFIAVIGLFSYRVIKDSIDNIVEARVDAEVIQKSGLILDAASTSEAAVREISIISTQITLALNPTGTPSPSEEDAQERIILYYELLNSGDYPKAWAMLTPSYRLKTDFEHYPAFETFCKTISQVLITDLEFLDRTDTTADYLVLLDWTDIDEKKWSASEMTTLIYDNEKSNWYIDK